MTISAPIRRRLPCVAWVLVVAVGGGALAEDPKDGKPDKNQVHPSGFLGDYSQLEPLPKGDGMLVYRSREGVLADYDAFVVEPVLIYFHPEAKGVGIDPAKLAELALFARDELVEALTRGGYRVVDEPGPGVAVIRGAITDVNVSSSGANVGTKAAGMAVGVGFLIPNVDVGGASMEAEIRDSVSGERLVAVVDSDRGRRFFNLKGMKKMGDSKKAFKEWAKALRQRLDLVHGKQP